MQRPLAMRWGKALVELRRDVRDAKCASRHVGEGKVQASVARCLRTPPYAAKRKDLGFDLSNRLRGQSYRSTIVICNCTFRADTVAPRRNKAIPL